MKKFPGLNLNHLFNLTDETGMLQHARYQFPNRNHGYCIDDNARVLLVLNLFKKRYGENSKINQLLNTYLSYIDHAYNPSAKRFCNFMSYSRQWLEESGSEDSQGRTVWAIGTLACNKNFQEIQSYLEDLLKYCLEITEELTHPRAIAYSLLGLAEYYEQDLKNGMRTKKKIKDLSSKLRQFFSQETNSEWLWHEETVTYDNSRIPQALISSGCILTDHQLLNKGMELLDWLIMHQFEEGIFSPIGNKEWLTPGYKSDYDQQPIEAWGMIDACLCAGKITGDQKYYDYAGRAFNWFLGENSVGFPLYDSSTGGCCDGLNDKGTNKNQGAESTIAWLHSLLMMEISERENNI